MGTSPQRDPAEARRCRRMEPLKGKTAGSSSPDPVCTKQQRIAELAKIRPAMVLTTLAHHMDLEWLREAYSRTRKDGAVGVDGQTATAWAADRFVLDEMLELWDCHCRQMKKLDRQ